MDIYLVTTRNGTYISIGKNEYEAKINFTMYHPSEKIRYIQKQDEKSLKISHTIWNLDAEYDENDE